MKKNIALVIGGYSGEYDISLKGGKIVQKNIDRELYDVFTILITKEKWVCVESNDEIPVDKSDFSITVSGKKIKFDCVFLVIHGTPGEDGRLQGYFDLMGMPYTSSGLLTSAITFNKYVCKQIVSQLGVMTAKAVCVSKNDKVEEEKIISELSLPCFVKPNNGGSSIGVSKVNKKEELKPALVEAFKEDEEVLIEEFISGTEITCGVIRKKGEVTVLPLTKVVSKKGFFDYEAKYAEGMAEEITPAGIPEEEGKKCREISMHLYKNLNCRGMVRFDYILSNGNFYFLEVNTIPGLSENSIVPKQANVAGISTKQLYSIVIEETLSKY